MANGKDDIRVALALKDHPKTLALIEEAGESAAWRLICLWLFAGMNRKSGVLRTAGEAEVGSGWRGKRGRFHAALVKVGWLEPDGVTLHDWADEQPWIAGQERRSAAARANAKARWNGHAEPMRPASNPQCGTDAERNAPSPSPSPSPLPLPTPSPSPATAEVLASPPDGQRRNGAHPRPPGPPWPDHGPVPPDSGGARMAELVREREAVFSRLTKSIAEGNKLTPREETLLESTRVWLLKMRGEADTPGGVG